MQHDGDILPIVQAAANGDAAAWSSLVDRYRGLVYSIPRDYSLPPDVCDDIFQTVFFLLFRNLPVLRDAGGIAKWLITTAERECWRVARKRAGERARTQAHIAADPISDDLDSRISLWERRQNILDALERMDERCRSLLTMLFRNPAGVNYDSVAASLNMPRGSIGPQRARCLKRLAELAADDPE